MSDVRGTLRQGKKGVIKVAEIEGKLTPAQWAELLEVIRSMAKKYPKLAIRVREFGRPKKVG